MSPSIFNRIHTSYTKMSPNLEHQDWRAAYFQGSFKSEVYADIDKYQALKHFGKNPLSAGTNCAEYYSVNKERLKKHIRYQEKLFKQLTNLTPKSIYFPKTCDLFGKSINESTVIPVTAYRLGYYLSQIKALPISRRREKIILEIGGGFGGLAYLILKNIPNVHYIIVDIPNTIPMIAYFLHRCGKKICLYGEYDRLDYETITKYDCTITIPEELRKLPDNICNVVVSTACLAELPLSTIDFYFSEIDRVCNSYLYIDSTNRANGGHVFAKSDEMANFRNIFKRKTPINCYTPWIYSPNDESEYVEERLYEKVHSLTKGSKNNPKI